MRINRGLVGLLLAAILAGCATKGQRAPVVERGTSASKGAVAAQAERQMREKDWRPRVHIVQKGDTLYSIAFNYGFDYHELAELNDVQDPSVIQIGQEIRLFPSVGGSQVIVADSKLSAPVIKDQPKLVKYAYSDEAVAQIVKPEALTPVVFVPKPEIKPAPQSVKPVQEAEVVPDADMEWSLPTVGKVISGFSESDNRKGVDISGKLGQPVTASAPGKVVYSGTGLRGYGKLVIIKHNNTFLSAYAHNDKLLVKEGETITRGQKIAEMGNTDADQVKLHFEVRRFGKPVDPAKYLSFGKS